MSSTEGTLQIKRVCLRKEELELLSKEDLIDQWLQQEKYINSLELKSGEVENSELVSLRESEEKLKQQQLEATRRENILVMRLTTKEQEMQEYASQIQELKQSQVPTVAQLRAALLDPAVNLVFERMRKEVDSLKARLEETQNELSAWKFTPDSNTGKRLMAKCRSLYQENEELGKMISAGRLAKLEGDLALQRNFSEEMKKSQTELDEFLQELDEDVEGMQSTIIYLQQKLREAKEQLKKLQMENELLSSNATFSNSETNESVAKLVRSKVEAIISLETESNSDLDHNLNHDRDRTNGNKSPFLATLNSPRTPTHSEPPSTPDFPEQIKFQESPPGVLHLNSPRIPEEPANDKAQGTPVRTPPCLSVSPQELPSTPEHAMSPEQHNGKELTDEPHNSRPAIGLDKPNLIQENGLKQGVICYGHQSIIVAGQQVDYKRETTSILLEKPLSPGQELTTQVTRNHVRNQYEDGAKRIEQDATDSATEKTEPSSESFPLDLVKKPDFIINHSPVSSVVVTSNVITSNLSALNSIEHPSTNVIVRDNCNVTVTESTNEASPPVIVPKLRLLATIQNVESNPLSASPSPPQSPNPLPVSVSPERTKRTRPLSDDEGENSNRSSELIISSPKKRKLAIESLASTTQGSGSQILNSPPSPSRDQTLSVDIDTEVQVAQTLACWAVASSKERTRVKSPTNDQRVSGLIGNGDMVGGSKLGEGQS